MEKIDEFEYFGKVIQLISANDPRGLEELISGLPEDHRNSLNDILQSKRIVISKNGKKLTVARRIFKAKSNYMELHS